MHLNVLEFCRDKIPCWQLATWTTNAAATEAIPAAAATATTAAATATTAAETATAATTATTEANGHHKVAGES